MKILTLILSLILISSCSSNNSQEDYPEQSESQSESQSEIIQIQDDIPDLVNILSLGNQESLFQLRFDKIQLAFTASETWSDDAHFKVTHTDSAIVDWSLADIFEGRSFYISIIDSSITNIQVSHKYQTSLSVGDDGAHLDLTNWLHYNSEFTELIINENYFASVIYSEEEYTKFPPVTNAQILKEVVSATKSPDNKFTRRAKDCLDANSEPCSVMINQVQFKISYKTGLQENESVFVIFNFPLGC